MGSQAASTGACADGDAAATAATAAGNAATSTATAADGAVTNSPWPSDAVPFPSASTCACTNGNGAAPATGLPKHSADDLCETCSPADASPSPLHEPLCVCIRPQLLPEGRPWLC